MPEASRGALAALVLLAAQLLPNAKPEPLSTCPNRSINYITHSLPQQCLATPWIRHHADVQATPLQTSSDTISTILSTGTATTRTDSPLAQNSEPSQSDLPPASTTQETPIVSSATKPSVHTDDVSETSQDIDGDSPLDNVNFLSFEEWKAQNLAKAGQSAENVGSVRAGAGQERRRPGINNALDSLGEDTEIEIDFGGFVNTSPNPRGGQSDTQADGGSTKEERNKQKPNVLSTARPKSKDAGKTCKERTNYASFDCAATVLKTNPECKGSNSVLVENKDSYMLNQCSAGNKFFIVELCDDILIDTIVLANFEFFSSIFRTFRVSVSDIYPVKLDKWRNLGTFEARNSRDIQAFLVENPFIWARYLRIEFLTHYGKEYYCPVSLLRVHGTTMMEEFNHDMKSARGEDQDSESEEIEDAGEMGLTEDAIIAEGLKEAEKQETILQAQQAIIDSQDATGARATMEPRSAGAQPNTSQEILKPAEAVGTSPNVPVAVLFQDADPCTPACLPEASSQEPTPKPIQNDNKSDLSSSPHSNIQVVQASTPETITQTSHAPSQNATYTDCASVDKSSRATNSSISKTSSSSTKPSATSSQPLPRVQSSSTQPPASNPTTQESFHKAMHKRLQLLELNSTLSLQYIEEQSRILRDAFSKVEKRQLGKTTSFLESLNTTVLSEVREFRQQYDQIWQSTVLELSSQRERSEHQVMQLTARIGMLADEILLQKRIAVVQFVLIVLCLGLVIFSRSATAAPYLEVPHMVQNAISKSSTNLAKYAASFDTPPSSPSATRPASRLGGLLGLGGSHRSSPSMDDQVQGGHLRTPSAEEETSAAPGANGVPLHQRSPSVEAEHRLSPGSNGGLHPGYTPPSPASIKSEGARSVEPENESLMQRHHSDAALETKRSCSAGDADLGLEP